MKTRIRNPVAKVSRDRRPRKREPFAEIIARYLEAVGDRREVLRHAKARYRSGRFEQRLLLPWDELRGPP
jgi:hypothetical protein